ncbi:GNAT family N-acetyltransferase [Salarchaeum japonicum]|uniref:GNAT family N-acetyltransferase n=1 Tax=Salarchaeum japonicum TaxID=555573 RepID=UPI003C769759
MFPETFETDRLRFERLCRDRVDVREYYDHASHRNPSIEPETRYLPWNPVATMGDAAARIDDFAEQWRARERAEWVIRPRSGEDGAGAFAGTATIITEWEKDLAVLGVWLREPFWGRRYSGERADALLEIAFDALDVGCVAIPVHGENEKSRRAVERYVERHGGRYEGRLRHHAGRFDEPADHHRFSITRAEYDA